MTMNSKLIRYIHGKEDRISKLPDEIILRILSLVGAEDAVRSGLWSKRFAYLWTNVASLYFKKFNLKHIYSILLFHKLSNLEKISVVKCYYDKEGPGREIEFGRLIRLLSLSNVKDVTLEFEATFYTLPQHFYANSSLKKLTLSDCMVETNVPVNWKSLQILFLSYIDMADTTINNVLLGCPSLEILEFSYCSKFTRIDMTNNKSLRKLVVDCYDQSGVLEIVAPHLQSLVLSGAVKWSKCKVLDAKSITNCSMSFYDYDGSINENNAIIMLTSLFEDLSHVEVLTIEEWVLKGLCLIVYQGSQCPMSKTITCLEVGSVLTPDDMVGIVCMLRSLNRLERLLIEFWGFSEVHSPWFRSQYQMTQKNESYWTAENIGLKLKTIMIHEVSENERVFSQNEILKLVEFLLKSAKFMENMTVIAQGSKDYLLETSNKLLGFPRSSPHAVVKMIIASE